MIYLFKLVGEILAKDIRFVQCHWLDSSIAVITFLHDITLHFGAFTIDSTC